MWITHIGPYRKLRLLLGGDGPINTHGRVPVALDGQQIKGVWMHVVGLAAKKSSPLYGVMTTLAELEDKTDFSIWKPKQEKGVLEQLNYIKIAFYAIRRYNLPIHHRPYGFVVFACSNNYQVCCLVTLLLQAP